MQRVRILSPLATSKSMHAEQDVLATREQGMDFYAILDQAVTLLRQRQRVTYRALQMQFRLDEAVLEALKDELLYAHPQTTRRHSGSYRMTQRPWS